MISGYSNLVYVFVSGGDVRLDVQGVESLANQVKDKKNPFVIAVRAVSKLEPGFR